MKFIRHASALLFLALFLVSPSSADSKKRDRKDESSNSSTRAVDANAASSTSKEAVSSAARTPEPQPKATPTRDPKSHGDEMTETPPKWTPMPALDGNPGLFTLETGEILPQGGFNFSAGVDKISRMPGEITVLRVVPAFGVGLTHWLSAFVQIDAHDHIHVDQPGELSLSPVNATNPQYRNTIYNSILPATGFPPAYVEDYPFASRNGGGVGEVDLGLKIGLLSERRGKPLSLSIRNDFYVPTKTGFSDLLKNEVQYGRFNYGIGVEASKTLFHGAILGTLNWAYRFTRDSTYHVTGGGSPTAVTLNLADQMRVGVGLLVFPDKRFQIISEYNSLIYFGRGIQNTSFGARDPLESISGLRLYPWRHVALDLGYRYSLSLTNHLDRNGFVAKLGIAYWPEKPREPDSLTSSCSVDKPSVKESSNEYAVATVNAVDAYGHPLNYTWTATGGKIEGTGPSARWDSSGVTSGSYTLTVHVDDGAGKTSNCSISLAVER